MSGDEYAKNIQTKRRKRGVNTSCVLWKFVIDDIVHTDTRSPESLGAPCAFPRHQPPHKDFPSEVMNAHDIHVNVCAVVFCSRVISLDLWYTYAWPHILPISLVVLTHRSAGTLHSLWCSPSQGKVFNMEELMVS